VGTDKSLWAESIRRNPTSVVGNFWSCFDNQTFSIDATMLRTNEWCQLTGFEIWWSEIANQVKQSAFSGGIHPFFLFNMCRSESAVSEMREVLTLGLQSQEANTWRQLDPWWRPNLGCAEIPDWEHFASPAAQWLWDQQHVDGYWVERGSVVVWLTVLVLDALELTAGGAKLTFGNGRRQSKAAPLVFVAYQHKDTASLEELRTHLGGLIHSDRIEFFSDCQIGGGVEWDPAIRKSLNSAKIIVPLVSPNFLGSKYIQLIEFPTAMARHRSGEVTVLPVLLEACDSLRYATQGGAPSVSVYTSGRACEALKNG
jgi:hypothetical protein